MLEYAVPSIFICGHFGKNIRFMPELDCYWYPGLPLPFSIDVLLGIGLQGRIHLK
jgi:Mg2+ and Co2+ transporter CorA